MKQYYVVVTANNITFAKEYKTLTGVRKFLRPYKHKDFDVYDTWDTFACPDINNLSTCRPIRKDIISIS